MAHRDEASFKNLAAFLRKLAEHVESLTIEPDTTPLLDFVCFYHLSVPERRTCVTETVGFSLNGPEGHLIDRVREFVSDVDDEELKASFKEGHANFLHPSEWFQAKYMPEEN